MTRRSILFVCIHNSARSQMAEAFVNHRFGSEFIAESAGIESGALNPVVVEAMREIGIDISGNRTKTVQQMIDAGRRYDWVITVCDEASAERCPSVPGLGKRAHLGFPDPSALAGSFAERLERTRAIRDRIADVIARWCAEHRASASD